MAHTEKALLVSALAFAGLIGCGGSDQNTPPQTAASQTTTTTTTGGPAPGSMEPAPATQGQYGAANPSTYNGSSTTTANPSATPSGAQKTWNAAPSAGDSSSNAITDDQIAGITNAANAAEVDQAKEVLKKTKSSKIRTFAQHMIADHGLAFKDQTDIERKYNINPKEGETSRLIQSDGKSIVATIQSASAADVDRQYIDAQVREHQTVLDTLDNKLIPNAQNGDLKSFLQKVREKVAHHLKDAQDIQGSLK